MKKLLSTLILLLTISLAYSQTVTNVDAIKFNELIHSGTGIVLDVRTPQEYSRGHIANSTLISIADRDFVNKVSLLQKDKPLYIYCLTGSRSRVAANYLAKIGFANVYNLTYGILDWQRNNLPVVQSENSTASKAKTYTPSDWKALLGSNGLVFVDFNAPWCAPCKTMNPIVEELSQEFKGKLKVEKIDVESNRGLAQANEVQSIPGFILFKNGQKVWMHKGVISKEELLGVIRQYM